MKAIEAVRMELRSAESRLSSAHCRYMAAPWGDVNEAFVMLLSAVEGLKGAVELLANVVSAAQPPEEASRELK